MAEMISMFHDGAPVAAILPAMTFSTDDCTLLIFEGTSSGSSEVRVGSSSESGSVNGLWRLVRHGLNGFRIRTTTTLSAGGFAAPQYWTVTGLSEEELPVSACQSGRLVLRVQGLSSGASVDDLNKDVGYIVFLRSRTSGSVGHESPEAANFAWYRNNVFLPWLQEVRSVMTAPHERVLHRHRRSALRAREMCVSAKSAGGWHVGAGRRLS